jgi:hypothetical protein
MEWIWKNWLDLGESFTLERLESWLNEASLERRARDRAPGRTCA